MEKMSVQTLFMMSLLFLIATNAEDWLINKIEIPTQLLKIDKNTICLSNGLVSRYFSLVPDFVTIDFYSNELESSILRTVNPEATIMLDNVVYNVGGVESFIPRAYFNRSDFLQNVSLDPNAFHFQYYKLQDPVTPFDYKPKRGAPNNIVWPPKGLRLDVVFFPPSNCPNKHQSIIVTVHYEIYVGIPLIQKWISIVHKHYPDYKVDVTILSTELLDVNQQWAPLAGQNSDMWSYNQPVGLLFIETDQSHGTSVIWNSDSHASDMPGSFEPRVNCSYAPTFSINIAEGFESFHVHELVIGSWDPERFALARHRMFRLLAPQAQENPIFFHLTDSSSDNVRKVIDQMADVGFEMLIYSFGSDFNIESTDEAYIKRVAADVAYANSKGIEIGGYDLIALTRQTKKEWMALRSDNSSIGSACFASEWYDYLLDTFLKFFQKTGLSMVETDGPYGGYSCASTTHKHHLGLSDSIYRQQKLQGDFYKILQSHGIYTNQPDYYFYQGGSKTGMGYDENQYSLPRWQDISISRQSIYDDTFRLIPTAGWMFVPLVQYHGGGSEAMFEPLQDHQLEYEWALAQYLGAGVAACYRGYRLYDSNSTRAIVKKWVDFYKTYRDILTSDIVHVKRPDMQSFDCFMHVNPLIENRALAMVFNPTGMSLTTSLKLPLYYSGLNSSASIANENKEFITYVLDRDYSVKLPLHLNAFQITWFLVRAK